MLKCVVSRESRPMSALLPNNNTDSTEIFGCTTMLGALSLSEFRSADIETKFFLFLSVV